MSDGDSSPVSERVARLIDGYLNDTLAADEGNELEAALRADRAAERWFLDYCLLHAELRAKQTAERAIVRGVAAGASEEEPPRSWRRRAYDWFAHPTPLSLTVAALFVATVTLSLALWSLPTWRPAPEPSLASPFYVARLTRTYDAEWSRGTAIDAGRVTDLAAGQALELLSGMAEVRFDSGVVMVLESPVAVQMLGKNAARLTHGRLTARVPDAAVGFTIESPGMRVVDLGTEFGMEIASDGAQVQVFEGRVEVACGDAPLLADGRGSGAVVSRIVEAGRTLHVRGGQLEEVASNPHQKTFVRAIDEGHWEQQLQTGLAVHLPLQGDLNNVGAKADVAAKKPSPPRFATGPGRALEQSLDMEDNGPRAGEAVSLNYRLPERGTIALWYYVTGPYYDYQTVFDNAVGSEHWEMWVYGNGRVSARAGQTGDRTEFDLDSLQGMRNSAQFQWRHLAFVWERDADDPAQVAVKLFIDGQERHARTQPWHPPGDTFFLGGGHTDNTFGRGRWADVRIYDRALTRGEIAFLFATAAPDARRGVRRATSSARIRSSTSVSVSINNR